MRQLTEIEIECKQKVLDAVNSSRRPLNVSEIRRKAGLSWETAKKYAVSLSSEGLINQTEQVTRVCYEKLGAQS